jgi:uncharacterized protein YukE
MGGSGGAANWAAGPGAGIGSALNGISAELASMGSYPVKTNAVTGFSGAGMSSAQVMEILRRLDPGAVADAGAAHTQLGTVLNQVAGRLTQHAQVLAENWSGSAAQAAMGKFQILHDQMTVLSRQVTQVGSVLTWLGTQVLPWAKALPDPSAAGASVSGDAVQGARTGAEIGALGASALGAGAVGAVAGGAVGGAAGVVTGVIGDIFGGGGQAADAQARQYIAALSEYLVQANNNLPDTIGAPGPGVESSGHPRAGAASTGVGTQGAPGQAAGAASGAGLGLSGSGVARAYSGSTGRHAASGGTGSGVPGAGSGATSGRDPVSSLQGVPSPVSPGGPSSVPPGSPVSGVDGTGAAASGPVLPGAPMVPGAELTGAAGLGGSGTVAGAYDVLGVPGVGPAGVGSGGVGPGGVGSGGASGAGGPLSGGTAPAGGGSAGGTQDGSRAMPGLPMGGAGASQSERERRRYAWMYDDEDIWGADGVDCVPPVIYGDDWQGPRA